VCSQWDLGRGAREYLRPYPAGSLFARDWNIMDATPIFDKLVEEYEKGGENKYYQDLLIGPTRFVWGLVARIPLKDVQPLKNGDTGRGWTLYFGKDGDGEEEVLQHDSGTERAEAETESGFDNPETAEQGDTGECEEDSGSGDVTGHPEGGSGGSGDTSEDSVEGSSDGAPTAPDSPVRDLSDATIPVPPRSGVRPLRRLPRRVPGESLSKIQNFIETLLDSLKTAFTHPTSDAA